MKDAAEKLVDRLFKNGIGQRGEMLVLRDVANRTMGGWSREAVLKLAREMLLEKPKEPTHE